MENTIHITGTSGQTLILSLMQDITDRFFPIDPDSNEALRRHLMAGGAWETFNGY